MDEKIYQAFDSNCNGELKQIIISNSNDEAISKIKIRPILLKQELQYQVTEYRGTKVFHSNYTKDKLLDRLPEWFGGLFKQVEIKCLTKQTNILISKKGVATVKTKQTTNQVVPMIKINEHDRKKQYILAEGTPILFMQDLGIMSADGKIIKAKYDKYKQINRYLEFIEDILPNLKKDKTINIIDFGCGKSYLTFAMYYYLHELMGYDIKITGLDLKEDVINKCNELSKRYGYDKLQFLHGDIADYEEENEVDMVVTLHACDTATDYALYKAYRWGAKVILSVPCCQHEINRQISCDTLNSFLKYGLIKERMSALITDSLRANILETLGYKVQILEFIDMEHTPKNILLRAVRKTKKQSLEKEEQARKELKESIEDLHVTQTLYELVNQERES